jgi:hypothetical protein
MQTNERSEENMTLPDMRCINAETRYAQSFIDLDYLLKQFNKVQVDGKISLEEATAFAAIEKPSLRTSDFQHFLEICCQDETSQNKVSWLGLARAVTEHTRYIIHIGTFEEQVRGIKEEKKMCICHICLDSNQKHGIATPKQTGSGTPSRKEQILLEKYFHARI